MTLTTLSEECLELGAARAGSFLARELEYLASRGYHVAEDGWSMIAPGM